MDHDGQERNVCEVGALMELGIFYLVSALLIGSAVMVVTRRGLFSAALFLAMALSLVGVLFAMLGADFLFAVQSHTSSLRFFLPLVSRV